MINKINIFLIFVFSILILFNSCEKPEESTDTTIIAKTGEITEAKIKNDPQITAEIYEEPVIYEKIGNNELRGVWIASVLNINFPLESGLSADRQKAEIDDIINTCKAANLNAIFFQVRPAGDALYNSKIFPISKYLALNQGDPLPEGFDPLKYIIQTAHKNNIELHAWINPYRITNGNASNPEHDLSALAQNNPAKNHPEWVVKYPDGKLYYNPGIPEVQRLIADGVMEIVQNYDIDGIHFDDYFYPYPVNGAEFDDKSAYTTYGAQYDTIGDFRRGSVNNMIMTVYNEIKAVKPNVRFGISPFGIWANKSSMEEGSNTSGLESYSAIYSDAKAWVEGGYIDYLCPQIYWAFGTEAAAYDVLVKWWSTLLDGSGVDLYIGHALYKLNDTFQIELEIPRQVEYARNYISVKGSVFYGYADLLANSYNVKENLKKLFTGSRPVFDFAPVESGIIFGRPANTKNYTENTVNIMGGSDPAFPVFYKNAKVTRTKSGYFSVFTGLENGSNDLVFFQNGKNYIYTINKPVPSDPKPYVYLQMDSYKIEIINPKNDIIAQPNEKIEIKVQAPSNSLVKAEIGGAAAELKAQTDPPNEGKYMTELYMGTLILPDKELNGEMADLGKIIFTAERDGEKASVLGINIKLTDESSYIPCEVKKDYTYIKTAPDSSFYDDYLPASAGMRDNITGMRDNYYKLSFGGYVAVSEVILTPEKPVVPNKILYTTLENTGIYTELKFKTSENVPIDAKCRDGIFNIILYNTPEDTPMVPVLPDNILFESLFVNYENNMLKYSFTLIHPDNFYGFEIVYDSGYIIIKIKNPVKITSDKSEKNPLAGLKIIIDAGHGGNDYGALGYLGTKGKNEKDFNLEIAAALSTLLKELGAEVFMIREIDETVDIYSRMDTLNKINPDLCVSIHHNSLGDNTDNSRTRGLLVLYCNDSGRLLAKSCSGSISKNLNRVERNVAYQSLAMLRNHKFPAALMEMLFLTNPDEYETACDPVTVTRSAKAVAEGIVAWTVNQAAFAEP